MKTILFIEDEEKFLEPIIKFLRTKGFNVICALNGNTGISIFEQTSPDVVILDLGLPDLDGRDVYKKLKEIHKDVPIVVLTGYKGEKLAKNYTDLQQDGIVHFLCKPCDPSEIETLLMKIVA